MKQTHIIVGTAGHVDHGKTRLTMALTGIDTDRLPEEKRRGLTIVPGFTYVDLQSGRRLGLIDVPGHEQFIKNMLSGVAGIDMALLVVAADEGIMPQTIEHLNILSLLGITKGVVAITKSDLVEEEWLELIVEDVSKLLAESGLRGAPIIAVSAQTGFQVEELKGLLDQQAAEVQERSSLGLCRIPVDRVFNKSGFGIVITGTLWSGSIRRGQLLELLPGKMEYSVRGIQVHGQQVDEALAGQRTALNLKGAKTEKIKPGCWLATPKLLQETNRVDVKLTLLKDAKSIPRYMKVRVFHGMSEVLGRVRLLDREVLEAGENCLCQLELYNSLTPIRGDRMILRSSSSLETIAGAVVLDVHPPKYKSSNPQTMKTLQTKAQWDSKQNFLLGLENAGTLLSIKEMAEIVQLSLEETKQKVETLLQAKQLKAVEVAGAVQYYSVASDAKWQNDIMFTLQNYHQSHPLQKGMPCPELRQGRLKKLALKQLNALLGTYAQARLLKILPEGLIAKQDFAISLTPTQHLELTAIVSAYEKNPFAPPDWEELLGSLNISLTKSQEYLGWLFDNKKLETIGKVLFAYETFRRAEQILRNKYPREFTIAQARDLWGTSRKYAQVLLDAMDEAGLTKRNKESRIFIAREVLL